MSKTQARKTIAGNDQRSRDDTIIGRLYFFKYDPKWKHKLDKYDKFPMVFPIESYQDGFLGLNLHYLDYPTRVSLLGKLLEYRANARMTKATRLRLSYQLIASTKNLNNLARPCIKRYLYNHVRSKFIEVYPDEFVKAMELPVEDWVFKR